MNESDNKPKNENHMLSNTLQSTLPSNTRRNIVDDAVHARRELEAFEAKMAKQIEDLRARLAKGTREDLGPIAAQVVKSSPLPDRIVAYLKGNTADAKKISKTLGEPVGEVESVLIALRMKHKLFNLGTDEHQIWSFIPGDDIATRDLNNLVVRLLQERPFSTKELAEATGARLTRVGGAVIQAQRTQDVVDMRPPMPGNGRAGRYFIMPPHARSAKLRVPTASESTGESPAEDVH